MLFAIIELSPHTAFMVYLGIALAILFGTWLYSHCKSLTKKIVISEKALFICEYCHYVYLEALNKDVTQCPQCDSYNKKNQFKSTSSMS